MPTYEYECQACRHRFEQFQSITAAPVRRCPKCGRRRVQRLISGGGGLLFKGSGFYITDYRSESYRQAAKSEVQPAGASSGESGKSEGSEGSSAAAKSKPGQSKAGKRARAAQ